MEFYAIIFHYKAIWILYIHMYIETCVIQIRKYTEQHRLPFQSQLYKVQHFANPLYDFLNLVNQWIIWFWVIFLQYQSVSYICK